MVRLYYLVGMSLQSLGLISEVKYNVGGASYLAAVEVVD
jgi:hypothetical protein